MKNFLKKEGLKFYRKRWISERPFVLYQDSNRKLHKRLIVTNLFDGRHYYYKVDYKEET